MEFIRHGSSENIFEEIHDQEVTLGVAQLDPLSVVKQWIERFFHPTSNPHSGFTVLRKHTEIQITQNPFNLKPMPKTPNPACIKRNPNH